MDKHHLILANTYSIAVRSQNSQTNIFADSTNATGQLGSKEKQMRAIKQARMARQSLTKPQSTRSRTRTIPWILRDAYGSK